MGIFNEIMFCPKCKKRQELCSCFEDAHKDDNACRDCEYWVCTPTEPLPGKVLMDKGRCTHPILSQILPLSISVCEVKYSYQSKCPAFKKRTEEKQED